MAYSRLRKDHADRKPTLGSDVRGVALITSAPISSAVSGPAFEVLRNIREDIVSGVFQPNDRLKFEDLRDRYDASIGTLREALLHLLSEGFVRSEVNRGFTVAPVSLADFADITEIAHPVRTPGDRGCNSSR